MGKGKSSSGIKRDPTISYNHKVDRITKWYNRLMKIREQYPQKENENIHQLVHRKDLQPLNWYISKIAKPKIG